jgi:hypothetical protein
VGATVTLGAPAVAVDPGGEASLDIRVRNTGSVVDEFSFDVLGDAAAWTTVEPATLSLFPGAEGAARVAFRPPRASTTPAGQLPFGVRVRSREDPTGSAVEEGTVDVGSFHDPYAELVPRTSRGSRGANHDLAVDNRGNTRLSAEIEATDADRLLRFDVNPPAVVVEPGAASFAKIRVSPAQRFWRGSPKTRPFQLYVRPEGGTPIQLDGTLLQESVLPPWFVKALLLGIAALIALIILFLFVLKPAIQSAASEAVASPLADLRSDVNEALDDAGLPTMGPDGSGGSGGEPTPSPTGGAPSPSASGGGSPGPSPSATDDGGAFVPGLGTLVDGRLDRASPVLIPTKTLFITDFVYSNPNGNEGAIVLERDGVILYQNRLENLRDLDFHYVTPIVVRAGQRLELTVECTSPGACTASLTFSGYVRP